MSSAKLKKDLSNCLINFDCRVLITDLLDDYQLSYEEVNTIVQDYLVEQEKKQELKFEKKYLVCGLLEQEQNKKEVYQIVEETKLKDWLKRLQNAESSLYSVEVSGGAKSAAPMFKPMRVVECKQSKTRQAIKTSSENGEPGISITVDKTPAKDEKPKETHKQQLPKTIPKRESPVKKISTKAEKISPEQKVADKKAPLKKGINNFFSPASTTKRPDDDKPKSGVVKPSTPKKMNDFFKKQTEKPASSSENIKKPDSNTSVQLFDDNEEEPEEVESSDEEEKLDALKRDIISSDVELEEEENDKQTPTAKRRRILDSDDEDENHPVKQEKLEIKEEDSKEEEAVAETFLDEDGFVITKKPKQKAAAASSSKTPATKRTPPVTIKNSPNETKKPASSKETKSATNPTAKTKQAGIMNFFSKK